MSAPILLVLRLLLALALYGFLGLVLYILWRDLKQSSERLSARQIPPIILGYWLEQEFTPYRFTTPVLTIGREPANDLHLDHPTVSGRHTQISYHHGHWWAEDLGSTNGTFLNDQPLNTAAVLTTGDELRCGQASLRVTIGDQAEPAELPSYP